MKELMLYIQNENDAKKSLTTDEHLDFVKKCEVNIGLLKSKNKLIASQPLIREGVIIRKTNDGWGKNNISTNKKVHVGYYHIFADNLEDAIRIAKDNLEFEYVPSASIEIRQIKTIEKETGFVYPTKV